MKEKFKKGVSLYFTVILLSAILVIALGLTSIMISQMKRFFGLGNSTKAFYAADTGIEKELYHYGEDGYTAVDTLDNNSSYTATQSCPSSCTIISKGSFKEANRAIQVTF